jgi:hypothetical protein
MSQNENPLTPDQNQPNRRLEDDQYYQHLQSKERFAGMTYDQIEAQIQQDIINLRKGVINPTQSGDQNNQALAGVEKPFDQFSPEPLKDGREYNYYIFEHSQMPEFMFGSKIDPVLLDKISQHKQDEIISNSYKILNQSFSKNGYRWTDPTIIDKLFGDEDARLILSDMMYNLKLKTGRLSSELIENGEFKHELNDRFEYLEDKTYEEKAIQAKIEKENQLQIDAINSRSTLIEAINVPEILNESEIDKIFMTLSYLVKPPNTLDTKDKIVKLETEMQTGIKQFERYAKNIQRLESQLDRDKNKTFLNLKYQDLKAKVFKKPKVAEQIDDNYETLESCQLKYSQIKERISKLSLRSVELMDSIQNPETKMDNQKKEFEVAPKYNYTRFIEEAIENPELLRSENVDDVFKPIWILFEKAKQSNQSEYISFGFDQKFSSLRSKIFGEDYTADQIQTKID